MNELTCDLTRCFLCRNCIPAWKELIALKKKTLSIKKGKMLFRQGEKVEGIFFLYSGAVKIHAPWADGREIIFRFARGGEIAGHRGLWAGPGGAGGEGSARGTALYPISATALEDTTACFVPNEFLEASLKANPSLSYTLMHFYAAELQKAEKRMRDLTHLEVKGRIANALLDIEEIFGRDTEGRIAMNLTRQDIAAYAGTTYETVFKLFNEWTAEAVLVTAGKEITLVQRELLARWARR
ncbi:MAG TPA: Crp/Fnr family transcriptional regulator [Puia sp.]|uniref:Crp/Fnr family transcriptional regulator n=1 Tax=Puia sp. TaxID=2045100 RepID=UPI002C8B2F47|nr:Crp/Fnr family transcriptional regulator [Puia sp.]HVU98177.1 Crp/Fnr family transcriptional regulator [Puia sp.]